MFSSKAYTTFQKLAREFYLANICTDLSYVVREASISANFDGKYFKTPTDPDAIRHLDITLYSKQASSSGRLCICAFIYFNDGRAVECEVAEEFTKEGTAKLRSFLGL